MPKRSWPLVAMAAVLLILLGAGLFHFAGLEESAAYPKMSSMNSGPEGAKLLYDTLANVPALTVSRNYLAFSRWHPSSTTILMLGVDPGSIQNAEKSDLVELERLSQPNNRVVLTIDEDASFIGLVPGDKPKQAADIKTRWGIEFGHLNKKVEMKYDASWKPVDGTKDAVEKGFGAHGKIVIALHSADLANKELAANAAALDQIPALIGDYKAVGFDEVHLGIEESGSIAGLIRRFRLQGVVVGLLILVGLFIWNQMVGFPPASHYESANDKQMLGADARGAFANLLSRHLTPKSLLESCVSEWNRVKPQQKVALDISDKADVIANYRQIQESLEKKRGRV